SLDVVQRMTALVAEQIRELHKAHYARLSERFAAIEKRLDGALFFKGVWAEGTEYGHGALVQHAGTAWVSTVEKATTKPGTSAEWRMLAKSAKHAHED